MALSKNQIAAELEERGLGRRTQMNNVLTAIAEIAHDEIDAGEDFVLPDVVKVGWGYITPRKKGDMYRKGETYVGFGGVEQVAEADSKPRKAKVKLEAKPAAPLKRMAPSRTNEAAQSAFLKTKVGKYIARRKTPAGG